MQPFVLNINFWGCDGDCDCGGDGTYEICVIDTTTNKDVFCDTIGNIASYGFKPQDIIEYKEDMLRLRESINECGKKYGFELTAYDDDFDCVHDWEIRCNIIMESPAAIEQ